MTDPVHRMRATALQALRTSLCAAAFVMAGLGTVAAESEAFTSGEAPRSATSTTAHHLVREAATRAVGLIDRTSANFLTARTCFSCHTQTLAAMVLRDARKVGIPIDEANFRRQSERAAADLSGTRVDTKGYALWALDIGEHAPDDSTERLVADILKDEKELGPWRTTVHRPPAEASRYTTNYVALRGLNRYGNASQRAAIKARATHVKQWLESAPVANTEDQVFRLRLAHELKLPRYKVDAFVQRLLDEQDPEGGWVQERKMKPDAYATGSVLVALHAAGGLSCEHPAWLRGLGYLLRTQKPDGSWHVASRATPLQEYFESGFPHGKDQFISAFATGWATDALLISLGRRSLLPH